jgi:hypothetical protein
MELQSHSSHSYYYYYESEERTDGRTDETSGLTTCPLNRVRLSRVGRKLARVDRYVETGILEYARG